MVSRIKIDFQNIDPKLTAELERLFGEQQRLDNLNHVLDDIPSFYKKIVVKPGDVQTWSTLPSGATIVVTVNQAKYIDSMSPFKLDAYLTHELRHVTQHLDAMSKAAVDAFMKTGGQGFYDQLAKQYNAGIAGHAIRYGFEELFNKIADNTYRRKVGDPVEDIGPFTDVTWDEMDDIVFKHPKEFWQLFTSFVARSITEVKNSEGYAEPFEGAFVDIFGRVNFVDATAQEITDIQRFESMFGGGIKNPEGTFKDKLGGGFEWRYDENSPFAGKKWQRGSDFDGNGKLDKVDKDLYDKDLYDRIANDAATEGKTWKEDYYRSKAKAIDQALRAQGIDPDKKADKPHDTSNGSEADSNPNPHAHDQPILLDLDGNGVKVDDLSRSTKYLDAGGDGLKHRTAWAGAGDGVLFYDADSDGTISQKREYIFTEWDPTASSDMEALRSYFDTNGDGKLTMPDGTIHQFEMQMAPPFFNMT